MHVLEARPAVVVALIAVAGAIALAAASRALPEARYAYAALGSLTSLLITLWLLRALRPRDRRLIALAASALGFFAGAAASRPPYPAASSFAAALLPSFVALLAGVGSERVAMELSRLEDDLDDPSARPRVIARAGEILERAKSAARAFDPDAIEEPRDAGDPRAIVAYASQVIAYARAEDGDFLGAIASLGEVPLAWMPPLMRPLMVANLAFFFLAEADPDRALAELDKLQDERAPAEMRPALRAVRAIALAALGRGDEGLALVGRSDEDGAPPERFRLRYEVARAHAFAAMGDEESARTAIARAIAMKEGKRELARWSRAHGPASRLFHDVLKGP